jgi:hypothetical protein
MACISLCWIFDDRQRTTLIIEIEMFSDRRMLRQ